jgi:Protein of unknown function (DUF3175)
MATTKKSGSVMRTTRKPARKDSPAEATRRRGRYWSAAVTQHSDALDLEADVFNQPDPRAIALSLKRSAERSTRRKATPYRSAMSMLTFYINRAGKGLSKDRQRVLERAKDELRQIFGRA